MKRLFLLIAVCMIGMVLPQGMWAGVTIDTSTSGKVVVTSENAGDFAAYLNSATTEQLNALKVNEIVFVGNFNKSDLSTLQNKGCATQKKVDMAEAKFIKSASSGESNYVWYESDQNLPNTPEGGKQYIVGGDLWKKEKQNPPVVSWIPATEDDYNSAPENRKQDASGWFDDSNKENQNGAVENGKYYKVPESGSSAPYVYYLVEKTTPLGWNKQNLNNGQEINSPSLFADEDEMNADTSAPDYSLAIVGGTVFTYTNGSWQAVTSSGDGEYDYTQMRFDYWGSNVEEIITSKYAEGPLVDQLCSDCSNLKTLTLSAGDFASGNTVLGNNINSLKTVNIKKDVETLSPGMFNGIGTLSTVNFDENGCQIETLPTGVFRGTGITEIEIPSSVELIEAEAFHSCASLETVTFVNTNPNPLIIKSKAFQNSQNIKDVYVEVKFSERHMICEYNAFDFKSMEGQTQENAAMTTLHFPDDDNSFNYYAGEWKKGMSMRQSDLNAFKDGLNVTYNGQEYIAAPTQSVGEWYSEVDNSSDGYYHPSDASKKYAPANGWQQFAKTDSKREIFVKGNIYMTYSTDKAYSLPTGIIAFRVTDYKEAEEVNGKTTMGKLVLKMIEQVPTETGMLLISTDQYIVQNEDVMTVFFFNDAEGTPKQYHYTQGHAGDASSNYLAPAVKGIEVGPVSKGQPNAVTGAIDVNGRPFDHRNFAMNKNTHQFVRLTHCTMPENRAFLSLTTEMFTNDNESKVQGPNPWNVNAGDAFESYETNKYDPDPDNNDPQEAKTNMFFEYDVEKYGMIWPLIKDNNLGITTGIKNVNVETVQEGIYTLQGVKVSAPSTKGIYIVNGKKVIIK